MALGTLAAVALGISAASGVKQAIDARAARKDQEAAMRRQTEEARAASKLKRTRENTGADVLLGDDAVNETKKTSGVTTTGTGSRNALGNVGGVSASKRVGL